jgi:hypothetical protein
VDRLKFWKRKQPEQPSVEPIPTIKRFNIQPRTDIGTLGLPSDPDQATRIVALRKRREALLHDVEAAEEAASASNRWRAEIALIDQAIDETNRDLAGVGASDDRVPGATLPATPITDVTVATDPVPRVRFRVGDQEFSYAEEIDWSERGHQLARSELIRESGDIDALVPRKLPDDQQTAIREHLQRSLFAFATDLRDRALSDQELPKATLADLAQPSAEYGGWLEWGGQSPVQQAEETERTRLLAERDRLMTDRNRLIEDEAKTAENLPLARRRLADVDKEITEFTAGM